MHPVLTFGSVELSTYVVVVSLAGSLGFWRTPGEAVRARLDPVRLLTLAMVAFVAGLGGARALSVAMTGSLSSDRSWWSWLAIWDRGGMVLYGGLALAVVAGLAYMRLAGLPPWEASDALVLAWVPCLALVRLGCFLNGCCYGEPTTSPLGIVAGGAPNAVNFGIPSHPAQLYDAAALVAIWGLLTWGRARRAFSGQITLMFLAGYALFRVFHETLRGDPRPGWAIGSVVLTFNQLASVALLAVAVTAGALLLRGPRLAAAAPDEPSAGRVSR